jgi:hypothetical protein
MKRYFEDFDFSNFWDSKNESLSQEKVNDFVQEIETESGYKLPKSYIDFMKMFNGGTPNKNCFIANIETSWSDNHICIEAFLELDDIASETEFMKDEWGYPDIGLQICDCPSAGHDIVMLDYTKCGKSGEPSVVHVDQSFDYKITILAKDFETFIRGLVTEDFLEE